MCVRTLLSLFLITFFLFHYVLFLVSPAILTPPVPSRLLFLNLCVEFFHSPSGSSMDLFLQGPSPSFSSSPGVGQTSPRRPGHTTSLVPSLPSSFLLVLSLKVHSGSFDNEYKVRKWDPGSLGSPKLNTSLYCIFGNGISRVPSYYYHRTRSAHRHLYDSLTNRRLNKTSMSVILRDYLTIEFLSLLSYNCKSENRTF